MSSLAIVVIGRNEGERLIRCLRSIRQGLPVVYVDSGSTDASVAAARQAGAIVVELDMRRPFTAARARNAGRASLPADIELIQFVDGDCTLQPEWLEAGRIALDRDPALGAVFGRRREVAPDASAYNWMCDNEWAVPPGEARYFGGDVMLRARALDDAGGYPDAMIAGEEPDLSIRMRAQGWRIACLPVEMTGHDAAITRFGQWWRRAERSGHAYAELAARHVAPSSRDYARRLAGVIAWTLMPVAGVAVLGYGLAAHAGWGTAAGIVLLALPLAQFTRLALRERRRPPREALLLAGFLMAAKPAQAMGALRFALARLRGKRTRIIEYKDAAA